MAYRIRIILIVFFTLGGLVANAQPQVVDEVVAIVGDNYILRSDIDKEFETLQEQMGKNFVHDSMRIEILDQLISKKLLLYKAQLDSVVISDEMVDGKMEERLAYVLGHFGGDEKALENYLGMTVPEFKAKTKKKMKEQLLVQEMQNQIMSEVKVSPAEVRKFFEELSVDSLPPVPAEVEVGQIIRNPKVSDYAWDFALEEATDIRNRLIKGGDFCFLARAYSDDPGSSGKCGELGYFKRGRMVPEFEAAAFSLERDSFSDIIRSQFGYHIIQLIDRRGESVNARHILISPELLSEDFQNAKDLLDSVRTAIVNGSLSFNDAVKDFSQDEYSSMKGGKVIDNMTGETKIPISNLDKDVYLRIKDLKVGEVSPVYTKRTPDGKEHYVIYILLSETPPHYPSLETDYLRIQNAALEKKRATALEDWIKKNKGLYYIQIKDRYASEPKLAHWKKD